MKIFYFDIWDGDKGVILAKDEIAAIAAFKNQYSNIHVEGYDAEENDTCTAWIETIGDVTEKETMYINKVTA